MSETFSWEKVLKRAESESSATEPTASEPTAEAGSAPTPPEPTAEWWAKGKAETSSPVETPVGDLQRDDDVLLPAPDVHAADVAETSEEVVAAPEEASDWWAKAGVADVDVIATTRSFEPEDEEPLLLELIRVEPEAAADPAAEDAPVPEAAPIAESQPTADTLAEAAKPRKKWWKVGSSKADAKTEEPVPTQAEDGVPSDPSPIVEVMVATEPEQPAEAATLAAKAPIEEPEPEVAELVAAGPEPEAVMSGENDAPAEPGAASAPDMELLASDVEPKAEPDIVVAAESESITRAESPCAGSEPEPAPEAVAPQTRAVETALESEPEQPLESVVMADTAAPEEPLEAAHPEPEIEQIREVAAADNESPLAPEAAAPEPECVTPQVAVNEDPQPVQPVGKAESEEAPVAEHKEAVSVPAPAPSKPLREVAAADNESPLAPEAAAPEPECVTPQVAVNEDPQPVQPVAKAESEEAPVAEHREAVSTPAPAPSKPRVRKEIPPAMKKHYRLGEILMANRLINEEQLDRGLAYAAEKGVPLGQALVQQGATTEPLVLKALAAQKNVAAWHLEKEAPSPEAVAKVPPNVCRANLVLPVKIIGNRLILAMRNPEDMGTIELVRGITNLRVEPVLAHEERLAAAIEEHHGAAAMTRSLDGYVQEALKSIRRDGYNRREKSVLSEADAGPVIGLVNQLLCDAIRVGASDLHIEPRSNRVEIRYRIDGQLQSVRDIPPSLLPMIVVRLKIMAELDIVEYRLPQDGRVTVEVEGREVDVRMSVLPSHHGQRIVMRILDKSASVKRLEEIGFTDANMGLFKSLIRKPYGMILVTGPTGSGKTTTLYAALNELKRSTTNVMTCEDPVEYEIDGINQSQVSEKVGLTFATQLRAILRQDPDVILVGEIRDKETAETAIRAALTGHLVLSTLHCNDAPSAIPRLIDMGIDPFLLSTSLIGIMSQRLLRVLCPDCRRKSEEDGRFLMRELQSHEMPEVYGPQGCPLCLHTGYRGRMAVHEIMPVTREVAGIIAEQEPMERLVETAERYGYLPMQVDAIARVLEGRTSITEAQRQVFFDLANPNDGAATLPDRWAA